MSTAPTPDAALDALRTALTHLRALAALPSPDPRHATAAEQVAAIIAHLEGRAPDATSSLLPDPPNPGATFGLPDPPSPG